MNIYDVGDTVRLRTTFTDSGGVLVDPGSVTVQYRQFRADPASVTTLLWNGVNSVVRVQAGEYYHDLLVNTDGEWMYRWNGLGVNASAAEGVFSVRNRFVG